MLIRILTSLVGLVVFFGVLFAGAMPFDIALCAVVLIMLYELYKSSNAETILKIAGYISGIVLLIAPVFGFVHIAVLSASALFLLTTLFMHGKIDYTKVFSTGFGTFYISLFMGTLLCLRADFGVFGVLLSFVCAWLTDTGAYFTGKFLGKHKLIPHVSPKKTVEGAIGGVVFAAVAAVIYLSIAKKCGMEYSENISYLAIAILGLVTSVLSQLGDLIASAIKRDCNVKDFGNLLPGHGGLLDRFDSVLFISPFVWMLLMLLN